MNSGDFPPTLSSEVILTPEIYARLNHLTSIAVGLSCKRSHATIANLNNGQ